MKSPLPTAAWIAFSWMTIVSGPALAKDSGTVEVTLGKMVWQLEYQTKNADGSLGQVEGSLMAGGAKSFHAERVIVSPTEIELRDGYVIRQNGNAISNSKPGQGSAHINETTLKVKGPSMTRILPK